jgi:hypothetical protein
MSNSFSSARSPKSVVSRGFRGRRAADVDPVRVPPGQYVTGDFPVLSAGPTPHTSLELWDFSIVGELAEPRGWTWEEFLALPSETITTDIHCVTKWSKLDTNWTGVSLDTLLEGVGSEARYVTAWCDGGYTTNLALEDVTGGRAWIAYGARLTDRLPAGLTPRLARTAHDSAGAALELANRTSLQGHPGLANAIHAAASNAFFHGFSAACLVAAGVSAAGAIVSLVLLPAHPTPRPAQLAAEPALAVESE